MATTKTTKPSKSSRKASHGKRAFKPSAFHKHIFEKPTTKRCAHKTEDGKKVCSRFAGHKTGHFYVTPKEFKVHVEAWKERFIAA